MVSDAFFWHEIEEELREWKMNWVFQGNDKASFETALTNKINEMRSTEIYWHEESDCSEACKSKGEQGTKWEVGGIPSRQTNLLISARAQRQTNAKGCWIFRNLDQLKSKDTMQKPVDWSPWRRKKNKWNSSEIKTSTIYLPNIFVQYIELVLISLMFQFFFRSSPWGSVYHFLLSRLFTNIGHLTPLHVFYRLVSLLRWNIFINRWKRFSFKSKIFKSRITWYVVKIS